MALSAFNCCRRRGVGLPGAACFGPNLGDLLGVVAEGVGDDGRRRLEDELAHDGNPGGLRGDAEPTDEIQQVARVGGLAGPGARKQPSTGGLGSAGRAGTPATRWRRWRRMLASGSGTGEGGSPKRISIWSPRSRMSSMVSRTMRVAGWAYTRIRAAAARAGVGGPSSVSTRRSRASRRVWVNRSPVRMLRVGRARFGMW